MGDAEWGSGAVRYMVWEGRGGARECNTQLRNASVVAQGWACDASAWARVPHIHMNMHKGCALCSLHCAMLCHAVLAAQALLIRSPAAWRAAAARLTAAGPPLAGRGSAL